MTRFSWAIPAILLIAVVIAYLPVFKAGFVGHDDPWLLTQNDLVQNISLRKVGIILNPWTNPEHRIALGQEYLPVRDLSHALEYAIWGEWAQGYHAVNVLIYALTCILLYVLLLRLTGERLFSALTSLLFALHPFHVESVAWVSGRKDVLFGLFYVLGLLSWNTMHRRESPRDRYLFWILTFLAYLAACTSKYLALTLPAALVLHDWLLLRPGAIPRLNPIRKTLLTTAPFFLFAGFFAKYVVILIYSRSSTPGWFDGGPVNRVLSAVNALRAYFTESVLPIRPCNVAVDFPVTPSIDLVTILSAMSLLGAAAYGSWIVVRSLAGKSNPTPPERGAAFFFLFFFVALSPVSNIIFPISALYAERYTYLALIGGPALLAWLASGTLTRSEETSYGGEERSRWRPVLAGVGLSLVVLVFGVKTYDCAQDWKSSESLWNKVLRVTGGNNHTAHYGLAGFYLERGTRGQGANPKADLDKAVHHLHMAAHQRHASLWWDHVRVYSSLGVALEFQGKTDAALEALSQAISMMRAGMTDLNNPYLKDDQHSALGRILINRASFLSGKGDAISLADAKADLEEAIAIYSESVQTFPDLQKPRTDRGNAYMAMAQLRRQLGEDGIPPLRAAIHDFTRTLEIDPYLAHAYQFRGDAWFAMAKMEILSQRDPVISLDAAVQDYTRSLARNRDKVVPLRSRGQALTLLGETLIKKRASPRDPFSRAIRDFRAAISLSPEPSLLLGELGSILGKWGNWEVTVGQGEAYTLMKECVETNEKAFEVNPGDATVQNNLSLAYLSMADYFAKTGSDPSRWLGLAERGNAHAMETNPEDDQLMGTRAMILERQGRLEEARNAYEKAVNAAGNRRSPFEKNLEALDKRIEEEGRTNTRYSAFALARAERAFDRSDAEAAQSLYEQNLPNDPSAVLPEHKALVARGYVNLARLLARSVALSRSSATPDPAGESAKTGWAIRFIGLAFKTGWEDLPAILEGGDFAAIREDPRWREARSAWERMLTGK